MQDLKRSRDATRLCAALIKTVVVLVRPILFAFLQSNAVKKLIVDLLRALAKTTDNTVDDQAVDFVERNLFPTKP